MTKMLPRVQNAIGELCLEIGMTQEGFQYFQKAWFNLLEFSPLRQTQRSPERPRQLHSIPHLSEAHWDRESFFNASRGPSPLP